MDATTRFKWALQALSQDAGMQRSLYPSYVAVADELALEFEETYARFSEGAAETLTGPQNAALKALDDQLATMSGPKNLALWTFEALSASPEWVRVRECARRALDALGWESSAPPLDRGSIYVKTADSPVDN